MTQSTPNAISANALTEGQQPAAADAVSHVRITTLDNGLTIATDPMPTVASTTLGCWIKAGSRNETQAENGAAHLLEHMVFKGTKTRSAMDISAEIEQVGGMLNAHTSREATAFHVRLLADDVPLGVDVISDLVLNAVIDTGELDKERGVVLAEIGQSLDSPDDVVFDHWQSTALPGQPLGRPILGTAETVGGMPRDTLAGFVNRHYRPDQMVFAASGAVDHDAFVDLVSSKYEGHDFGADPIETAPALTYQGGETLIKDDLEQVHWLLGFEGISVQDDDLHALAVLNVALGGGMSSRLFQEVREKRGLVYSVFSFTSTYADGGLFGIYAGTAPDKVAELAPVVAETMRKAKGDITGQEFDRAKAQIRAALVMALESTSSRAESVAQQMIRFGRPIPLAETLDKLDAVTPADLDRMLGRLLASAPTLTALGPVDNVPKLDQMTGWLAA
ncbi:MAG: pitrilysin family protein [Alphaproteobacteria bacterium]